LPLTGRLPGWLLGLMPIALVAVAAAVFAAAGAPGLAERRGPAIESLTVERTALHPGRIELTVRNDGPDPVQVAQVAVNDAYVSFDSSERKVGRLDASRVTIDYPWIEGEAYELSLLTSTGQTIAHEIPAAVETPSNDVGFFGLMALLGLYVGIVPITIGMLWLPFIRRIGAEWIRFLMAVTIGLMLFLAIDATLEGVDVAGEGSEAFGGAALVFLGAAFSYLQLAAIDSHLRLRQQRAGGHSAAAPYLALLVAIGVGLHNLGEGLAIGSAYAVGALALGAFLVIGFALHNTTEGLAIVAPVASRAPSLRRLLVLGLIAGGPVIVGAWIGAAAFNTSLAAFLLGAGAGAIAQVIQQLAPSLRDRAGRVLHPVGVAGIVTGLAVLYVTSLMVSV
jgi:zinc transporter ZupT